MFKITKFALAAGLSVAAASASANVVLDLFDTLQPAQTVSPVGDPGPKWSQVGGPADTSIFGGYRDLGIGFVPGNVSSNDGPASIAVVQGIGPGAGTRYLSFSNDTGVAATGVVRWDGSQAGSGAVDAASLDASINKTGIGAPLSFNPFGDFFEVLIISSDLGFQFSLEIFTDANNWSRVDFVSNAHAESFPGTVSLIPLAAFLDCNNVIPGPVTTCGGAGGDQPVDFSNVGAVQFVINGAGTGADIDLRLNQVQVVPEPSILALVGVGLLGAAGAARRRKSK